MSPSFITLEGGEGSGKSTQLELLFGAFNAAKIPCIKTREPGGSPGAEHIRNLLVNGDAASWDPAAETLLFYAARLDHVNRLIKPALAEGKHVLCDRFADSTLVYQGISKGLSETYIRMLHQLTLGNFAPMLTIILDIDPSIGLERAKKRGSHEARFEGMELDFHRSIRAGFLSIAGREPQRCIVLDASKEKTALHAVIVAAVKSRLGIAL